MVMALSSTFECARAHGAGLFDVAPTAGVYSSCCIRTQVMHDLYQWYNPLGNMEHSAHMYGAGEQHDKRRVT